MKTLIGMGTFGLLQFSKLVVERLRETVKSPYDLFVVVGKPGDTETIEYLEENKISHVIHNYNLGFPKSVNDIYEFGWKINDYDNIIIIGNDVLPYPYAVDSLIEVAETTDYEWICSTQYSVQNLCSEFPEAKRYFNENVNYRFNFNMLEEGKPWDLLTRYSKDIQIAEIGLSDVQNLCLYKRSTFDKIGYTDVNFYPAYYIDNDYARRGVNAHVKGCTVINSVYFHFWSRTVHEGSGGSNGKFFDNNRAYYITKWGGDFASEKWTVPFNGEEYYLHNTIKQFSDLNIPTRDHELETIAYWISKSKE